MVSQFARSKVFPLAVKSCLGRSRLALPMGDLYCERTTFPTPMRHSSRALKTQAQSLLGSTNTPEFLMAYETDN